MIRTLCSSRSGSGAACSCSGVSSARASRSSLAPISVAQPIFASGIVLLLVLSHFVLHDHLRKVEWSALADDRGRPRPSRPFGRHPRRPRRGEQSTSAHFLLVAIPTAAAGSSSSSWPTAAHNTGRVKQLRAPLFGLAAGLLYGVAGLGLKSASTYVQRYGLFGSVPHLLVSPELYVLAVAMATGLVLFQTGLQRCSASVVSPVNIVTSIAYVIAVGTVLFNERLPTAAGPRACGWPGSPASWPALSPSRPPGGKSEHETALDEQSLDRADKLRSAEAQPVDVGVRGPRSLPSRSRRLADSREAREVKLTWRAPGCGRDLQPPRAAPRPRRRRGPDSSTTTSSINGVHPGGSPVGDKGDHPDDRRPHPGRVPREEKGACPRGEHLRARSGPEPTRSRRPVAAGVPRLRPARR